MVVHSQISTGGRVADSAPVRALPPGQVIEAKVVSSLDNGLTRVALGKSTVDLPLPPGLQPGETVHLQARGEKGADAVEICQSSPDAAMPIGYRKFGYHRMVLLSNISGSTIDEDQISRWRFRQIDGDSGLS